MTETVLHTEPRDDGVTLLTLNRPAKRNALNTRLRRAIADELAALGDDDTCRAVVLTGAGGTFCAGFDLKELQESASPDALFADADAYHHAVHTFPKPIIAAIAGPAVAGGLDLALMCDVWVAAEGATFGQPQVRFGVPASYELLRSVVTEPVARELCLTGRVIDSAEAHRAGLVHHLVGGDAVDEAVTVAVSIAAVPAAGTMKRQFIATQPDLFGRA
jgi:enoyl-CoA hydratase